MRLAKSTDVPAADCWKTLIVNRTIACKSLTIRSTSVSCSIVHLSLLQRSLSYINKTVYKTWRGWYVRLKAPKGCSDSDVVVSFSKFLRCDFTQSVLLTITCCARAVLIRARLRKPHTNEVSFVNVCVFWVGGGVATQGIPLCRRRSKAASFFFFFNQLRPWASASFISIYIHPSGTFIYAKSDLSIMVPFWIIHTSQ